MELGAQNALILNRTELIRKFSSEALLFCKPGNTFTVNEWEKKVNIIKLLRETDTALKIVSIP